jgi:hypothetical protein
MVQTRAMDPPTIATMRATLTICGASDAVHFALTSWEITSVEDLALLSRQVIAEEYTDPSGAAKQLSLRDRLVLGNLVANEYRFGMEGLDAGVFYSLR